MLSELGVLGFNEEGLEADELVIYLRRDARPTWIEITWKVLNPLGERCYGPFSQHLDIPNDGSEVVRFTPTIDVTNFDLQQGHTPSSTTSKTISDIAAFCVVPLTTKGEKIDTFAPHIW